MNIKKNRALTLAGSIGAVMAMTISVAVAAPAATSRDTSNNCTDGYAHGFSDVTSNNVHESAIACVKEHDITKGKTATTYSPAGYLTKAQLASFLVRTIDAASSGAETWGGWADEDYFTDDDGDVAHEDNINKLAHVGIVPSESSSYSPGLIPDRGLMATMTARALAYYGKLPTSYPTLTYTGTHDCFSDDGGAAGSAAEAEEIATNLLGDAAIVTGTGDGTFGPNQTLRRDQMASFLARAYDLAKDSLDNTANGENSGKCVAPTT